MTDEDYFKTVALIGIPGKRGVVTVIKRVQGMDGGGRPLSTGDIEKTQLNAVLWIADFAALYTTIVQMNNAGEISPMFFQENNNERKA